MEIDFFSTKKTVILLMCVQTMSNIDISSKESP